MLQTDVLIIGAGPTGLALALWLTKLGVPVRIIDKAAKLATTTRALTVQARILELYSQVDLADAVVARSCKIYSPNAWINGSHGARTHFADVAVGMTAYPFVAGFPQNEHEQLLISRLSELGVSVELGTSLESFSEATDSGSVHAVLRAEDGSIHKCEAKYIAGCDGARSTVRHGTGMSFPGGTYEQEFYVADIEAAGPAMNGELHVCMDTSDTLAIFPLPGGRARLIGIVSEAADATPTSASAQQNFEQVRSRAVDAMGLRDVKVNWFATYRSHHRVVEHFRKGHAFLVGDAAHIHSPAGGQGLNTGIGDAINLAWKMAAVLKGQAQDSLLDTYEEERIRFARKLVATTDQAFALATKRGYFANFLRSVIVRFVAPFLLSFRAFRRKAFRAVSQLAIDYTGTALAEDAKGVRGVRAGERLPWVEVGGEHNYASLSAIEWQLHIYGSASEDLAAWCKSHSVRLTVFGWKSEYGAAGLMKDAVYLLRPDTYVALVDAAANTSTIEAYFTKREITIASR